MKRKVIHKAPEQLYHESCCYCNRSRGLNLYYKKSAMTNLGQEIKPEEQERIARLVRCEIQIEKRAIYNMKLSTKRSLNPFLEYQFCSDYVLREAYSIFGTAPYVSREKAIEAIQNSPYKPFDRAVMQSIIDTIPRYMIRFSFQGTAFTYYEKTLKDAKKTLSEKRYQVEHGELGRADKVTLNAWYETWLHTYKIPNIKETSVRTYNHWFTCCIQPTLGNRYLTQIKPVDIQKLINDYQERGLSVKTIYSIYGVIFDLFEVAVNNDRIIKNPAKNTKLPKQEKVERHVLSVSEQTSFLAHLKHEKWLPHEPLFVTMLGTGMRVGEAIGLTWDCVDFDRKEIRVDKALVYGKSISDGKYRFTFQTPKTTSSKRVIPMLKEVENALRRQYKAQARLRLLIGEKWQPLAGFENLVFANMSGTQNQSTTLNTS